MKKRSLLFVVAPVFSLLIAGGVVAYWTINQPREGTILQTSTHQPKDTNPFMATDGGQQLAQTDCFSYELPFTIKYPKQEVTQTGCVFRAGLGTKPGLFSIAVQTKQEGYELSQDPGVVLREKEDEKYRVVTSASSSSQTVLSQTVAASSSGTSEVRQYQTDTELVTFIWQQPLLVTISMYELGRVDETIERWMAELVETVRETH